MKIDAKLCKKAIVEHCNAKYSHIYKRAFGVEGSYEDVTPMMNPNNWKRLNKEKVSSSYNLLNSLVAQVSRNMGLKPSLPEVEKVEITNKAKKLVFGHNILKIEFGCKPYNDQIRAYIFYTNANILHVEVVGT